MPLRQSERRRFKRRDFDAEIDYAPLEKTSAVFVSTGSKNLSPGGVCIITFERLSIGCAVTLRIALPKFVFLKKHFKRYLYAKGTVIWTNALRLGNQKMHTAYESGIDFFEMEAADRELIRQFAGARPRS